MSKYTTYVKPLRCTPHRYLPRHCYTGRILEFPDPATLQHRACRLYFVTLRTDIRQRALPPALIWHSSNEVTHVVLRLEHGSARCSFETYWPEAHWSWPVSISSICGSFRLHQRRAHTLHAWGGENVRATGQGRALEQLGLRIVWSGLRLASTACLKQGRRSKSRLLLGILTYEATMPYKEVVPQDIVIVADIPRTSVNAVARTPCSKSA